MKKRLARMSIGKLSVAVLMACAGLAQANLLTNGDFETAGGGGASDVAGWAQTSAQIARVAQTNPSGHGDFVLQRGDSVAGFHWAAQTVAVTAGVEYTASAEFKGLMQAGEAAYIYVGWLDSGGSEISKIFSTYTTADVDYVNYKWVSRSTTEVAPVGAVNAQVRAMTFLDGNGDSGLWSDNVTFDVIPEPATLGLVCLMGGAVVWVRKRFMI